MVRRLLRKQHAEMRRLILLVERGPEDRGERDEDGDQYASRRGSIGAAPLRSGVEEGMNEVDNVGDKAAIQRISGVTFEDTREEGLRYRRERLATAVRMLYLLEELLTMQDYAFSRMGTFAKG
jgi:hypothetical protein